MKRKDQKMFQNIDKDLFSFYSNVNYCRHARIKGMHEKIKKHRK